MDVAIARRSGGSFRPAWFDSLVRKITRADATRVAQSEPSLVQSFSSDWIDTSAIDSLYRLARLLAANDALAQELVVGAYRAVARSSHSFCGGTPRTRLFEALHQVFQRNRAKYEKAPVASNNSVASHPESDSALIRRLLGEQDPLLRCFIFLKHCENLSLSEIAKITGSPQDAVRAQLLNFRNACGDICRSALAGASA